MAKFIYLVVSALNLGSGTTIISNLYLKFFKNKISLKNFKFRKGVIFVTGTNGKSSTSKILTELLEKTGNKVLHNNTGGNILRSILGMFLISNKLIGNNTYDFLVLEVDEASISSITRLIKPSHLIILNFSRDQLDRYFEIENISQDLIKTLGNHKNLKLIFNLEDEYCCEIAAQTKNETLSFKKDLNILSKTNFNDSFMASNLSAVITTLKSLDIKFIEYEGFLKDLKKPFGREEKIVKRGKEFEIHLAKNPASFNSNLIELSRKKNMKHILFVINDNISDGTDISWIYDIDSDLLQTLTLKKKLYFSGKRAYEMANRIQYASTQGKIVHVETNLKRMFKYLFEKDFNEVVVLCNYSSMLETRKILTGRKIL